MNLQFASLSSLSSFDVCCLDLCCSDLCCSFCCMYLITFYKSFMTAIRSSLNLSLMRGSDSFVRTRVRGALHGGRQTSPGLGDTAVHLCVCACVRWCGCACACVQVRKKLPKSKQNFSGLDQMILLVYLFILRDQLLF